MNPAMTTLEQIQKRMRDGQTSGGAAGKVILEGFDQVIEYRPEDMTITVQAGMRLRVLQELLGRNRQWLPIDPPFPEETTLHDLISRNLSGPHRCGFGTVRDYLIGLGAMLADGRVVRSGGRVVKNVAGFDLLKVFVGGRDVLGIPVEATFKVWPVAEREVLRKRCFPGLADAAATVEAIRGWMAPLAVFDLVSPGDGAVWVVAGVSGAAEAVDEGVNRLEAMGLTEPADLVYDRAFWAAHPSAATGSCAPTQLIPQLETYRGRAWVARAADGWFAVDGPVVRRGRAPRVTGLERELKRLFDPTNVLPSLPW